MARSFPPCLLILGVALLSGVHGNALRAQTVISGTYNGATISGDISIANNTSATFTGGTTFTGANATFGTSATLYWQQVGTLTGKAFTFGTNSLLYINGASYTVTFDPTSSATGNINIYSNGSSGTAFTNQGTITHTGGTGSIYAATFTNSGSITANAGTLYLGYPSAGYNSTNTSTGTITANGSGTTVYLRGNFANSGTLTAQNSGVLLFDGTNTTGNLGNVQIATGGHARLGGTITNTNLTAPTGGSFELYGGTISGGTIAPGALTFTSSHGELSGATLNDNLTLLASTYVHFLNGASFTGATATVGNNSYLYWEQIGTLAGKALNFGSNSLVYINGTNNALTLDPASTATGDVNIYSNGSSGTAFTNQGTITYTGGSGSIYAATFTNSGSITASAGTLYLGYPSAGYNSTNASNATITANGSGTTVYLRGNFANNGTLFAQNSGVLLFDGTNTTGNLGNVQIASGGHARLGGTITNTNLIAPTGGTFELYGGTISGGTIAPGALSFTSSHGDLSGATLNDNLTLLASTYVHFLNGASFTGATATLGNNAYLYWEQIGTLAGKALNFGSNSLVYINGTNNALTLDPTSTATGDVNIYSNGSSGTAFTNQGTITYTGGSGSIYASTFTNSGSITANAGTLYLGYPSAGYNSTNASNATITANGSGTTVYLRGNFANSGTLTAQNSGVLLFDGTNTTGNLGNVQIATGGHARLGGTITNTNLTAPTGGSFELYGGTISGGTIAPGALTFTSSHGDLSGATLNDNLTLLANTYVHFLNGASFTGATATLGSNAYLYWEQVGTLAGKALNFGSNSLVYLTGNNNALTLDPTSTATGDVNIYSSGSIGTAFTNQGTITYTGGSGSIYASTFTNSGSIIANAGTLYLGYPSAGYNSTNASNATITANGSGTTVYLRGNFANNGILTAQNSGVLVFDGTNTTGNLGNVQIATGGHARLGGTITNTNLTAPTGGTFELYGGTISGGTIAPGALTFTSSHGNLSGATLNDNLTLAASTYVHFLNGASFTGATATLGNNSYLYWEQIGTLAGKALNFGSNSLIYINGTNDALTLDSNSTATGDVSIYSNGSSGTAFTNQGTITHTGGTGSIYAATFTNSGSITANAGTLYLGYPSAGYNSTNSSTGTITANGSGTTVYLRGNFANSGILNAQNSGALVFDGTNTTSNLGNVQIASGGHARLGGTMTNTALPAPTGGSFELYGGTINGGTIAAGALTFTSSHGDLVGATINDNLTVPASSYVHLLNGTTFTGSALTLGNNAGIYWEQAGTLANKALTLGSGAFIYLSGANTALTLDSGSSVTGDASIYTDGSAGTSITNQGAITHNTSGGILYAQTFTNTGSIIASAGSLSLGTTATGATFANNSGALIRVTGGANVSLQAPGTTQITNNGTVDVQSGTLFTNNHLTNGSGGTISGAGIINGNVVAAGGTLAPGNSIGTLTFQNGTLTVTNASVFAVELGGASSDQLVFQNPPSVVNIGTGLLTLSLTLLAPPTDNTTYNLIRISSGGSGISGTFAGLPSSGNTVSATFASTTYPFTVNYSTNLISLNFASVPEPSTYALIAVGFGLLALSRLRRRK